jgi:hypothetical protein
MVGELNPGQTSDGPEISQGGLRVPVHARMLPENALFDLRHGMLVIGRWE